MYCFRIFLVSTSSIFTSVSLQSTTPKKYRHTGTAHVLWAILVWLAFRPELLWGWYGGEAGIHSPPPPLTIILRLYSSVTAPLVL